MILQEPITHHLTQYAHLCQKIFNFLLEENNILTQQKEPLKKEIRQKKESMLQEITNQNKAIQSILKKNPTNKEHIEQIRTIQSQLLKILMLNRDNEQLLLRNMFEYQNSIFPKSTYSIEKAAQSYEHTLSKSIY